MIYFSLDISWPLARYGGQSDYFYWDKLITKNKALSIQVSNFKHSFKLISFDFHWSWKQDHAGLMVEFGLLGLSVLLNFYDARHWNYEQNRYMTADEEANQWVKKDE